MLWHTIAKILRYPILIIEQIFELTSNNYWWLLIWIKKWLIELLHKYCNCIYLYIYLYFNSLLGNVNILYFIMYVGIQRSFSQDHYINGASLVYVKRFTIYTILCYFRKLFMQIKEQYSVYSSNDIQGYFISPGCTCLGRFAFSNSWSRSCIHVAII